MQMSDATESFVLELLITVSFVPQSSCYRFYDKVNKSH